MEEVNDLYSVSDLKPDCHGNFFMQVHAKLYGDKHTKLK